MFTNEMCPNVGHKICLVKSTKNKKRKIPQTESIDSDEQLF